MVDLSRVLTSPTIKPAANVVDGDVDSTFVPSKCDFIKPGLSNNMRIVINMLDRAEEAGRIKRDAGDTLLVSCSGNSGASVAMIGAMRGYKCVIITNDKCSLEKQDAIKLFGAELIVVPSGDCFIQKELDMATLNPNWYSVNQYDDLDNPFSHYLRTETERKVNKELHHTFF